MMSLSSIKGGACGASDYYLKEEKEANLKHIAFTKQNGKGSTLASDYYLTSHKNTLPTQWFGKLATSSKLTEKAVDDKTLNQVLSGKLSVGDAPRAGTENRRTGYDLTFSAPKGASIMALTYGDTRISEAHLRVVKTVLSEIEKNTAQVRLTQDKTQRFENTEKLIFGLIQHQTSRENEPQLHTHALMANLTQDSNGKVKNLASQKIQTDVAKQGTFERIMQDQKYYSALYHSTLGGDLKEMGYTIKSLGNGQIDIADIPEKTIEAHSTRREQIIEHNKAHHLDSSKARDIAAQATRKAKTYDDEADLQTTWREKDLVNGFDGEALLRDVIHRSPHTQVSAQPIITEDITQSVHTAVNHLSRSQSKLNVHQILSLAMGEFSKGHVHDMGAMKLHIEQQIEAGRFIPLTDNASHITTPEAIAKEQTLMKVASATRKQLNTQLNDAALNQLNLNKQDRKTLTQVFESKSTVHLINVNGGSKGLVNDLLHVGRESQHNTLILAPDFLSKTETEQSLSRPAFTATQWLKNLFTQDKALNVHQALQEDSRFPEKGLVIVEHANKLGIDESQLLIEKAHDAKAKVVFLNHHNKRQSFAAGNAMETLQASRVAAYQWQEQKRAETKVSIDEQKNATQHVAHTYAQLSPAERQNTQVLTQSALEAEKLNIAIRHQLDVKGQLGEQRLVIPVLKPVFLTPEQFDNAASFKPGMVMTEFVDKKPRVHTVLDVDKKAGKILLETHAKNEPTTTPKWHALSDAQFSKRSISISTPKTLEVAEGDTLRASKSIYQTEVEKGQRYDITKVSANGGITMKSHDGNKIITLPIEKLYHTPLDHAFAQSLNQRQNGIENITFVGKSYQASKNLLNELLDNNSQTLTFVTNDADKLKGKLNEATVRPSSISQVMTHSQDYLKDAQSVTTSQTAFDKTLSSETSHTLYKDVANAIEHITHAHQPKAVIEKAVSQALNHITEKHAAMRHPDLVKTAMTIALDEYGTPMSKEAINEKLLSIQEKGELLSSVYSDGTRWTTKEAIECEKRILTTFKQEQGTVPPLVADNKMVNDYLNQKSNTVGQNQALTHLLTTQDRFIAIQGFAGTGKSTMLKQGIELTQKASELLNDAQPSKNAVQFRGLAPTHAAVNELKEKGVPSQTVASFLQEVDTKESSVTQFANTVFLVDESSMLSNKQLDLLTQNLTKVNARGVLLGDMAQLQSQEAGKPFELAISQKALNTSVMKDIVRQANQPTLKKAVEHIIDGHVHSVVEHLNKQHEKPELKADKAVDKEHDNIEIIKESKDADIPLPHVISTYEKHHQDERLNRLEAEEKIYGVAAEEYLSRTPYARDNTLIIAYSNNERDHITTLIRNGLQKEVIDGVRSLGTENKPTSRLKSLGYTREEMKMISSYKKDDVFTDKAGNYHLISNVDSQHKIVEMINTQTGEVSHLLPEKTNHKMTELWHQSELPLSVGDKIMWRKANDTLQGNEPLTVTKLAGDTLTVKSEDTQKTHRLNITDLANAHWDYRYTRTADMAQGATYENVITTIKSSAKLTNLRRAYIDVSRASDHIMLITDDIKNTMLSWLNHDKDSSSALETLHKLHPEKENYFNHELNKYDNPAFKKPDGSFNLTAYAKHLNHELLPYTESLAIHYLGTPNRSKSNADTLSFGIGKSQTQMSLTGQWRGFYKNWDTGEKGSLINLIKDQEGIGFKEAVNKAEQFLNEPEKNQLTPNSNNETLLSTLPKRLSKLKEWAIHYDKTGSEINNTPAEKYLNAQGIDTNKIQSHSLQYHDSVYSSETKSTHPALIATYKDKEHNTQAVEMTYLTEQGEAANLNINKRILGNKSKHLIEVNDANHYHPALIVEGTEKALSTSQALNHQHAVYSIDNLNHLKSIDTNIIDNKHIIILDNNKLSPEILEDIKHHLNDKGIQVEIKTTEEMTIHSQEINPEHSQELNNKDHIPDINNELSDKEKAPYLYNDEININDKEKEINKEASLDKDSHHLDNTPTHSSEKEYVIDELSF